MALIDLYFGFYIRMMVVSYPFKIINVICAFKGVK